jgi:hypothetical protein
MHAIDGRYAKFFLFTETEVEILCESDNQVWLIFISLIYLQFFSS